MSGLIALVSHGFDVDKIAPQHPYEVPSQHRRHVVVQYAIGGLSLSPPILVFVVEIQSMSGRYKHQGFTRDTPSLSVASCGRLRLAIDRPMIGIEPAQTEIDACHSVDSLKQ